MNTSLRIGLVAALSSLLIGSASQAATIFSDTFTNMDNWTTGTYGTGSTAPVASGGLAVMDAGSTAGATSMMRSLSEAFNPFNQAYTVSLAGITLTGGPGAGSKPISYIMIGRTTSASSGGISGIANYIPGTVTASDSAGQVYVQILERASNVFTVRVGEAVGIGTTGSPAEINISGAPTALDWSLSINGSSQIAWSLTLTGASFTTQSSAGTLPYSGLGTSTLSGTFSAALSSTALTNAFLTFGEQNNAGSGAIGTAQTFTLDSVNVESIPEPSSVALVALGLLCAGGLCRRKSTR